MIKHLLVLPILMMLTLAACSKDEPACSNASNINDASCQKNIPTIDDRPLTLAINFKDSYFFDQNSRAWQTVAADNLNGGVFGTTVSIYSNFLNLGVQTALNRIYPAVDQKARPAAYAESAYNTIPYIEVAYEPGVDYIYNYVKRDLNNNIVFEKTGQLYIHEGRALLPLINEVFDYQFYSANAAIGSRFIHSLAIAAQSASKRGARTVNIEFETILQIPNTNFTVDYASDINNFNLKNRWFNYFNGTDFAANDQMKFFTLKEIKDISEQVPLDIRVVFQEPPKLQMEQEVFFELPLDLDALKANGQVIPQRGYAFYVQKGAFDSDKDFKMKIRMNNQFVTLQSQREFEVYNLPPGTPWNMEFFYDFNQNPLYNGGDGKPLLQPLRPICNEIANTTFSPIQETNDKNTAIQQGGFIALCHPKTNQKLIIPSDQLPTTPFELTDTFYNYFSYFPYDSFKKEMGHFYGVRRVTFKAEGCVRVYARQPSTPTWLLKSQGSAACDEEGVEGGASGWVYFYAEKSATIFDDINNYEGVVGLKNIIQFFGNRPIRQTPFFYFDGHINNNRHLK